METCGMTCVKYLLFIFNFFFAISGIGIIIAGTVLLKEVDDFGNFLGAETIAPPIILIVAGVIAFVVAFLGCYGAIKESCTMLMTFAILLLVIFVMEVGLGIAGVMNTESAKRSMKETMKKSRNNFDGMKEYDRMIWARLQSKLECCGVDGPEDWRTGPGNLGSYYPESCCKGSTESSTDGLCGPSKEFVYSEGCYEKLGRRLREGAVVIMGFGIGLGMIELAGVVLSCLLATAIKRERAPEEEAEEEQEQE